MKSIQSYVNEKPTICNICGGKVILIKTGQNYARSEYIYKCIECGASVGTHPKTDIALGTLADSDTKAKRRELHTWFDNLWDKHEDREIWYEKLAKEMNIPREQCHIGIMTKEQLDLAIKIVKQWWLEKYDI